MTETEWLGSTKPGAMLEYLRIGHLASDRKLRLFLVACCSRILHLLVDERSRRAVEIAGRFAEGQATEEDLLAARRPASEFSKMAFDATANYLEEDDEHEEPVHLPGFHAAAATSSAAYAASYTVMVPAQLSRAVACRGVETGFVAMSADGAARAVYHAMADADEVAATAALAAEDVSQCRLLRDIVGNPFHVVRFNPTWNTQRATALAQRMYESQDFSSMPELADALEDAGCTNADMLNHCRDEDLHVRGCWVVDLILGKN